MACNSGILHIFIRVLLLFTQDRTLSHPVLTRLLSTYFALSLYYQYGCPNIYQKGCRSCYLDTGASPCFTCCTYFLCPSVVPPGTVWLNWQRCFNIPFGSGACPNTLHICRRNKRGTNMLITWQMYNTTNGLQVMEQDSLCH